MRYLIVIAALFIAGCDSSATNSQATQPTAEDIKPASTTPEAAPETPAHYYSVEDGGEYGYQRSVSKNDADSGQAQSALVMMRYLGEKGGIYTIAQYDGGVKGITSCKMPCEFMKVVVSVGGQTISKSIVPANGTIAQAALADAMRGFLKVYKAKQDVADN